MTALTFLPEWIKAASALPTASMEPRHSAFSWSPTDSVVGRSLLLGHLCIESILWGHWSIGLTFKGSWVVVGRGGG